MSKIDHPPHYNAHPSGVEAIRLCEHLNFCLGNAVKYLARAPHKGDWAGDMQKARWYLARQLATGAGEAPGHAPAWAGKMLGGEPEETPLRWLLETIQQGDVDRACLRRVIWLVDRHLEAGGPPPSAPFPPPECEHCEAPATCEVEITPPWYRASLRCDACAAAQHDLPRRPIPKASP